MYTLAKTETSTFFVQPDGYQQLEAIWRLHNRHSPAEHFLYQALRGKNLLRSFGRPLHNRGWALARWAKTLEQPYPGSDLNLALAAFKDVVAPGVLALLRQAYAGKYGVPLAELIANVPAGPIAKQYTYIMVRSDLPVEQQIIQAAHAAYMARQRRRIATAPHIVLGQAGTHAELQNWKAKFWRAGIPAIDFHDGDLGITAAFCTAPIPERDRGAYQEFPLLRHIANAQNISTG